MTRKKKSDSTLSDEQLLLFSRMGEIRYRDEFVTRQFRYRHVHFSKACPDCFFLLDEWERNEVFFRSFLLAEGGYRFGKGKFSSFFRTILRNEVFKELRKKQEERERFQLLSLDQEREFGSETVCLHDIISGRDYRDDPAIFLEYADTLRRLGDLPKEIEPRVLDIASLVIQGHSISSACRSLGLNEKKVRFQYEKFRKWANEILLKAFGDSGGGKF